MNELSHRAKRLLRGGQTELFGGPMTGRTDGTVLAHTAVRLTVPLNQPLSQAVARFEELVPAVDIDAFLQSRSWDETIELARANGPLGLMRFWKLDYAAILTGSGTPARSFGYLIGNQTIAEQMIRHEPEVVLYAPLRTAIYEGAGGRALFVIDQPSTLFGSFGNAEITNVGRHLDALIATLLDALGAVVPTELTPQPAT
jgi:uncharacterized protein (DUF302 family)